MSLKKNPKTDAALAAAAENNTYDQVFKDTIDAQLTAYRATAKSLFATAKTTSAKAAVKPVWPDEGPMTWAPRPTVAAITANDLRTRLYQFADDSMLGRRIGEPKLKPAGFRDTDHVGAVVAGISHGVGRPGGA